MVETQLIHNTYHQLVPIGKLKYQNYVVFSFTGFGVIIILF